MFVHWKFRWKKETNAMKQKMDLLMHEKMNLMAEVRFLRRRYECLMKNQLLSSQQPNNNLLIRSSKKKNKDIAKEKSYQRKEATKQRSDSAFDLEEIDNMFKGKEATLSELMPLFKLKQKRLSGKRVRQNEKEKNTPHFAPAIDLNSKGRSGTGNEAFARDHPPAFDLNQISREEEEVNIDQEDPRVEEAKRSMTIGGNEERSNDTRAVGFKNGPNKVGKRKILWQD